MYNDVKISRHRTYPTWVILQYPYNCPIIKFTFIAEANSRKKKVYEQQENEENPLRCPVKLYEFYISKW